MWWTARLQSRCIRSCIAHLAVAAARRAALDAKGGALRDSGRAAGDTQASAFRRHPTTPQQAACHDRSLCFMPIGRQDAHLGRLAHAGDDPLAQVRTQCLAQAHSGGAGRAWGGGARSWLELAGQPQDAVDRSCVPFAPSHPPLGLVQAATGRNRSASSHLLPSPRGVGVMPATTMYLPLGTSASLSRTSSRTWSGRVQAENTSHGASGKDGGRVVQEYQPGNSPTEQLTSCQGWV